MPEHEAKQQRPDDELSLDELDEAAGGAAAANTNACLGGNCSCDSQ